jgi:hypothetical protein
MSDEAEDSKTPAASGGAGVPASATTSRRKSLTASLPLGRRVRFALLRLRWEWWVAVRRVGLFARRHAGAIRRMLMVLVGLGLGVLADFFGAGYIPKSDLANYLVATGAMIGGTTAIVFSISLFLLQGVSDMYSSRHLEDYVNHWRDQLIFPSIIVVTLGFFATALYVASLPTMSSTLASAIVAASLLLVGVVFGLIDQQYEAVRRKVSPARVTDFLRTKANGFLRQMERDAAQIAAMVSVPAEGMTRDEALAVVYNRVMGSLITDLGLQTELLVDIARARIRRRTRGVAQRSVFP